MLRYHMELYDYVERVCHGPLKGMVLRIVAGKSLSSLHIFIDNYNHKRLLFITTLIRI